MRAGRCATRVGAGAEIFPGLSSGFREIVLAADDSYGSRTPRR